MGNREDLLDRFFLDALHHGLEHLSALVFVFDERVALTHGTQADTFLEVVHFVEVLTPETVNGRDNNTTFKVTHRFFTKLTASKRIGLQSFFRILVDSGNVTVDFFDQVFTNQRTCPTVFFFDFLIGH